MNSEQTHNKKHKVVKIIGYTIGGIFLAVVFALLFGIVVQHLWNWLMVGIFELPAITFWQAFGIIILAKILFGGFGHHHDGQHGHVHKLFKHDQQAAFADDESFSDDMEYLYRHKNMLKKFWKEKGREEFMKYKKSQTDEE